MRYDTQFRIVITRTMKARLERAAKREGIPHAEFARRALQERIDRVTAEAKRQAAERKTAKAEPPVPPGRSIGTIHWPAPQRPQGCQAAAALGLPRRQERALLPFLGVMP